MLLWLFRLHVQISFSIIQPSCFACSALANSRACDLTCFAAGRSLWSGLWCSFSKWCRYTFCAGSGLWCLSVVSGVADMCVANGGGARGPHRTWAHVISQSHTQGWAAQLCAENPWSVIAHTHMCVAEARNPWSRFRCLGRLLFAHAASVMFQLVCFHVCGCGCVCVCCRNTQTCVLHKSSSCDLAACRFVGGAHSRTNTCLRRQCQCTCTSCAETRNPCSRFGFP